MAWERAARRSPIESQRISTVRPCDWQGLDRPTARVRQLPNALSPAQRASLAVRAQEVGYPAEPAAATGTAIRAIKAGTTAVKNGSARPLVRSPSSYHDHRHVLSQIDCCRARPARSSSRSDRGPVAPATTGPGRANAGSR